MGLAAAGGTETLVGYKAKKNSDIIDLSKVGFYEPSAFWVFSR